MHPILGRYGGMYFYSYTVLMAVGLAVALGLVAGQRPRPGWANGLLLCLLVSILGGRLGFVLANWAYFQEHRPEIGLVWRGTLSYHGGLLAGLITMAIIYRDYFSKFADLLAPAGGLLSAFGWLACLLAGYDYGRETFIGPLAAELPDNYGVWAVRYQTQLAGILFSLLIAGLIWWLPKTKLRPGQRFWLALLLISSGRAILSLYRGDTVPLLATIRLDTLLDTLLALFCLLKVIRINNDSPFLIQP